MPEALAQKQLVFAGERKTCSAFTRKRATRRLVFFKHSPPRLALGKAARALFFRKTWLFAPPRRAPAPPISRGGGSFPPPGAAIQWLFLAVFALACAARPGPAVSPAAAGSSPKSGVPSPPSAASAAPGGVEIAKIQLVPLEPPPLPASLPRFEVLEPSFGDTLELRFASKQPVRIRADANLLTAEAAGIAVSLDGGRPRRVLADSAFVLGDLLADGQRLGEGPHSLLVFALAPDGRALRVTEGSAARPFNLIGFFVGARSGDPPNLATPQLFCLSPVGTQYLKPDSSLVFELFATGPHRARIPLRVRAEGLEVETTVDPGRSYAVRGLPVGDVRFSAGEALGARAECVVTVNAALEEPQR